MENLKGKAFQTRAVHAGERLPPGDYTPVTTPIVSTVGFCYESLDHMDEVFAGEREGWVYPRYGSPTVAAFEAAVADLESGQAAYAVSSGMAAVHLALLSAGVKAGEAVVGAFDLYGASFTMLRSLFADQGVRVALVDSVDLGSVEAALERSRPAALLVETISNPLLKVADVPSLAELAHRYHAQLVVDNTFATPCLFNPLDHGADYVLHSATKYLSGHGDVLGGIVVTSSENRQTLYEINKIIGSVLGPFEAWLALRGLKTLPLRFKQQSVNALELVRWLSSHPRISRIYFPGHPGHSTRELAQRLFGGGFGAMLSFEIEGAGRADVFRFMEKLRLIQPATTLGDIYSLVLHPASTSHRGLTEEERMRVGIPESLVRISVGIEDVGDLIQDLEQALR
jgi:cystathionine beta-lyase/cystathionine gamma-synthase